MLTQFEVEMLMWQLEAYFYRFQMWWTERRRRRLRKYVDVDDSTGNL